MNDKKRVYCLYRVSTIGQVEKDDIPMQKQYCREFVSQHPDWAIEKEFYEKGVSGFKLSAKERDAVQEIQKDAVEQKFDILLVYMFDRLGRRDDETPFVVEWFVNNGIEVWSAVEGQQRFDTHVDKLLNYIRYWQASGESIKTSVRVKTRLEQLTENGCFTGGAVPYGYHLVKQGRLNKKNREVYDIAIDDEAAEIVRLIFHKYVFEGYGVYRICRYLKELGIVKSDGKDFPTTSLNRIIKNPLYTGVIRNGEACSEPIPELQIIDKDVFERAQKLRTDRTTHHGDTPLNMKGKCLLSGNIFCGHCRNRLTLTTNGKRYVKRDGEVVKESKIRYVCHYNVRHPGDCDGQSGYGVKKLDGIVDKIIRYQFAKIKATSGKEIIDEQHEKAVELAKARYKISCSQLAEKQRELSDYEAETIKVIRGESRLNIELLNDLVEKAKTEIQTLSDSVDSAKRDYEECAASADRERQEFDKLESWADLYDKCTFEAKKMIITQFVKSVYVYRDYSLDIEFNVSFQEFKRLEAECREENNAETGIYVSA